DTRRRQAVLQVEDVHAQRVAGGQDEGGQAAQGATEQQVFQHLHGGSPVQGWVGKTWAMACSAQPSSNCAPPAPATPMAPITWSATFSGTPPPSSSSSSRVLRFSASGVLRARSASRLVAVLVDSAVKALRWAARVLCGPTLSSRCSATRLPPRSTTAATAVRPSAWQAARVASSNWLAR